MNISCPYDGERHFEIIEHDILKGHLVLFCFNCRRVLEIDDVSNDWMATIEVLKEDSNGRPRDLHDSEGVSG